jgi:hypothetical protein
MVNLPEIKSFLLWIFYVTWETFLSKHYNLFPGKKAMTMGGGELLGSIIVVSSSVRSQGRASFLQAEKTYLY